MPQVNDFSWSKMSFLLFSFFFVFLFLFVFHSCNLNKIEIYEMKRIFFFYLI